jgi:MFS family permease
MGPLACQSPNRHSGADPEPHARWHAGVSRYEWLVLVIASAGWVFDAFEGQIFNITRNQLLSDILGVASNDPAVQRYGDIVLGVFLAGGTAGGVFFGWLGDRIGRRPTMMLTILMYSIFSGLTYFAHTLWEVGILRFLVAMGVGGEWAVAAALVAEVFPKAARAYASGIFHSTSNVGTWLAALAGLAVGANWRYAYLIGVVPALLVLGVRAGVKEPETWLTARQKAMAGLGAQLGSIRDLFLSPRWGRRAILGMLLAAVGLGSFWGVTVAGQDLAREMLLRQGVPLAVAVEKAKFAYGIVEGVGAGLGMLCFGPVSVWLGRKRAFVVFQLCSLMIIPLTSYLPGSYGALLLLLPLYGFFTNGLHAGFAVYFPELFPHHLRSTGAGFCFNGGRLLAAPVLLLSGWLKALPGMDLRLAVTLLGLLFIPGVIIVSLLPETRDQPLPE